MKMKKIILFTLIMVFTMGASTVFASKPDPKTTTDNLAAPVKTENKLSEEELSRLTKRVEEIRDMDKTNMTAKEKRGLKKELKEIKTNVRKDGGGIYIGVGTLVIIIILLIILL
jgi:uncharacterized protein YxeA